MIRHFLITRFNVPFSQYVNDKTGNHIRDENWLNHRFNLFSHFCFPSVQNQTNQNFTWFVFFDINTPDHYKDVIEKYSSLYSNFTPLFIKSGEEFIPELRKNIFNMLSENDQFVITSRIDNDDALFNEFIDRVQKEFDKQDDIIINFETGIILDTIKKTIYRVYDKSNPFLSRIERVRNSEVQTAISFKHSDAAMQAPVKQIHDVLGWLIVIHNNNLINVSYGKPLYPDVNLFKDFNICLSDLNLKMDYIGLIKFYFIKCINMAKKHQNTC